ncbi:MAG: Gfo/Idh/MocA family oxidoreductase [Candidatus Velthaea sp.]
MKYRVGIVGSGFGGAVHAPAFKLHPQFEPVAIASPARAQAVASERGIPHAFASIEEMLAGVELDVIAVSSPPFDHHRSVLLALAAKKHVLCEKPFALSVAEAEEMVEALKRAGTVGAIAHEFRYASAETALKEMILNGHLQRLRGIEITRFGTELLADFHRPRSTWWFSSERGGGVGNSIMPHLVDLANWYAGRPPVKVTGFARTANPNRRDDAGEFTSDVADGVFALIDYGDGLVARVSADSTMSMNQSTIALHAEHRTVVASGEGLIDMKLFSVEPDEQDELELKPSPYQKYQSLAPNLPPFMSLLDDFAERLTSGAGDTPTFEDALQTQRVLAAAGYGS